MSSIDRVPDRSVEQIDLPGIYKRDTRRIGHVSLGLAVGGLVTVKALEFGGVITGPVLQVLATGFEASTVGGLADWYAVTVLFRRAPRPLRRLPLFDTHSDLVLRNRTAIAHRIADMVQKKWLADATMIRALLRRLDTSRPRLDRTGALLVTGPSRC